MAVHLSTMSLCLSSVRCVVANCRFNSSVVSTNFCWAASCRFNSSLDWSEKDNEIPETSSQSVIHNQAFLDSYFSVAPIYEHAIKYNLSDCANLQTLYMYTRTIYVRRHLHFSTNAQCKVQTSKQKIEHMVKIIWGSRNWIQLIFSPGIGVHHWWFEGCSTTCLALWSLPFLVLWLFHPALKDRFGAVNTLGQSETRESYQKSMFLYMVVTFCSAYPQLLSTLLYTSNIKCMVTCMHTCI